MVLWVEIQPGRRLRTALRAILPSTRFFARFGVFKARHRFGS